MLESYVAKVGHNLGGAAIEEGCRLLIRPDSNDQAETADASRRNAGRGVLEYDSACRGHAQTPCSFQKHVGSRLSAQTETVKIDSIHFGHQRTLSSDRRAKCHCNDG
jgi:hypothetical protein